MSVKPFSQTSGDEIFIEDFEIAAAVGTTPEERAFPQVLVLTLRLFLPLKKSGESDHLRDTVDYAHLIEDVRGFLAGTKISLLETVAERVAAHLLRYPLVETVEVKIAKKIFTGVGAVGVTICRTKAKK